MALCEDSKSYCHTCRIKLGIRTMAETGRQGQDDRLVAKLLVKFKTGKQMLATAYKIDTNKPSFKATPYPAKSAAEEKEISFSDVKYVALVQSLTGEKSTGTHEYQPKGSEVVVHFQDGEIVRGFTLKAYADKDPRFSVIPEDPTDNRMSLIIERSAVARMELGRIPKTQELRTLAANSVRRLILHYYYQHPDIVTSIDELAAKLERTAPAVERELEEFMREGLIRRLTPDSRQLKFSPSKDPIVRQAVSAMARDIEMLYLKRKPTAQQQMAPQKPTKPAPQWPL
jgi:hypothetical protein